MGRDQQQRQENLPFSLEPQQPNGAAVLLVHGFTATPREMRRVAESLAADGFRTLAVCLPGHGTTPEDLAERTCEEWLQAVAAGYAELAGHHRVYGVGMSSGALLLLCAAPRCTFSGLVLLSPYLRLRHRLAPLVWLLRYFRPFQHRPLPAELRPYYYERRPLAGVHQLQRLIRTTRSLLPQVTAPVLAIAAVEDPTVEPGSAWQLMQRLGGERREFHLYGPGVGHVLTTRENPQLADTLMLVSRFLQDLERRSGPGGDKCRAPEPR
ncbi:MAG: alpha/beta fold hydrolase [Desulfuromonadales bacterium]|nr:alpha/beta fold hydrolase [Desulfuromonadales bacterium]